MTQSLSKSRMGRARWRPPPPSPFLSFAINLAQLLMDNFAYLFLAVDRLCNLLDLEMLFLLYCFVVYIIIPKMSY